jgi:small subunit ribosomal protein S4e
MVKNHIKRINAPKKWDMLRKEHTFISRPNPGRNLDLAISLNTALKEMLGKTKTTKESKYLIKYKGVLVNGVRRYDEKFPVGFLDVLSIPAEETHYRLLVSDHNTLVFQKIGAAESKLKLSKITGKHALPGGRMQLNCSDGTNFLAEKNSGSAGFETNDSIVYALPEQTIKEIIKLEKGCLVFLYQGKHIGQTVRVDDFKGSSLLFKSGNESYETKRAYALAIGKEKPAITITTKTEGAHQVEESNAPSESGKKHKKQ